MSTTSGDSELRQQGTQPSSQADQAAEKLAQAPSERETAPTRQQQDQTPSWYVFRGRREAAAIELPPPPPWRDFSLSRSYKGETFQPSDEEMRVVNAAIYLRRPLLITGYPGTGKSSLAYGIAKDLNLGEVLLWPITSRSQLKDGLYSYDAIGRLQASNMARVEDEKAKPPPIGQFLRLGPLGTAFADSSKHRPRVLLIDEIDKSDIDLPNDLLNVFEDGQFEIPELARLAYALEDEQAAEAGAAPLEQAQQIKVRLHRARDENSPRAIAISEGVVRCEEFPIVILTSNGERALPAPFLRRCLRLEVRPPDEKKLKEIVRAHFRQLSEQELPDTVVNYIQKVVKRRTHDKEYVATDQLMNAIHLVLNNIDLSALPEQRGAEQEQRTSRQLESYILEAISTVLV